MKENKFKRSNKVALLIGKKVFKFAGIPELNMFIKLMQWERKVFDIINLKK